MTDDKTTIPTQPGYYLDRLGNSWRLWNDGIFAMQADLTADPAEYGPWQRLVMDRPPVYLAADLWDALGAPTSDFDAYLERNGWANTWSNLLVAVRDRLRPKCGHDVEGESCVLSAGHLLPHYGPSDVGSHEPVPVPEPQGESSDAQVIIASKAIRADLERQNEERHDGPYTASEDGDEGCRVDGVVNLVEAARAALRAAGVTHG